nr:AAA family ATPase [Blastococcus saxobsidens]
MNSSLARHLNLRRWWAQDKEFKLRLTSRERDLVFTISDRTGTDYSFKERSRGLRYFLSYYVQLKAHYSSVSRPEILLMDEPDAYLSSAGQRDLLRILEDFALPEDGSTPNQVVYVTHSPFLLNRNAGQRIRVLDKGNEDEGTRVVHDATRNHYEPLRSSLGAYVAETAFIGGSNLFVEGLADQVILSGTSVHLRATGSAPSGTLDLNSVTIVPAGSADSIPYLVYLARGRDQYKPPCVALLDGDQAGIQAEKKLRRGEASNKRVLLDENIVRLDIWGASQSILELEPGIELRETEDMIPAEIATSSARYYANEILEPFNSTAFDEVFTVQRLRTEIPLRGGSMWDAVEALFERATGGGHIDKVGFAKAVVAQMEHARRVGLDKVPAVNALSVNFSALLSDLSRRLRFAETYEERQRRDNRLRRVVKGFLDDYTDAPSRDTALSFLEQVESALDDSDASDTPRALVAKLRRQFELTSEPLEPVHQYSKFRDELQGLLYQERLEDQARADHALVNTLAAVTTDGGATQATGKPRRSRRAQGPGEATQTASQAPRRKKPAGQRETGPTDSPGAE